ncbi:hypothetical protein Tco_0553266 [Tanacetum coccineum]
MLCTTPNSFYDPNMKAGLGYKNPERLKKDIEAQPKMYNGKNLKYHELKVNLPDSEETLEDAEKSRLKMKDKMISLDYSKLNKHYELFVPHKEVATKQNFLSPPTSNVSPASSSQKSNLPPKKMQKEQTTCDISWKSKTTKLNGENVSLDIQIESLLQERENIKLEYQKFFNSIKTTRGQHQREVNELIENVNQKTYAYGDVRSKDRDLLMIISELKSKLKTVEKGKNVNTKFDEYTTLRKLIL